MFILLVKYKCKPGCRDAYLDAIRNAGIDELSKSEEGNIRYEYSFGLEEDVLILTEVWKDAEAIEIHKNSEHFGKLGELKAEFVDYTEIIKYSAEQV